ncbi:MAG: SDR family oxidoreductase [Anaerolineae bacterium]|nr:SDR family oxidoreductase [Anaerolineae bacterium]
MTPALAGQVALVTGGAKRVGEAIALELAACGADVLLHYHSSARASVEATLNAIRARGVRAAAQQADLGDAAGVESLFAGLERHFGRLDILVNSAALFQQRRLQEVSLEDWERVMAVNLRAPFLCTQAAARRMQTQRPPGGVIINILDRGVDGPWQAYAHHGVSKAALWALTQVSALELAPAIRVNAVVPGPVLPPAGMSGERWQAVTAATPLGRGGSARDVAQAVCFLACAEYVSGEAIRVNGGEHLGVRRA